MKRSDLSDYATPLIDCDMDADSTRFSLKSLYWKTFFLLLIQT